MQLLFIKLLFTLQGNCCNQSCKCQVFLISFISTRNGGDAVQLLLIYGANVFMEDNDGKRPSQRAKPVTKRLLLQYETQPRSLSDCCRISILQYYVIGKRLGILKNFGLPPRIVQYILSHKL